MIKTIEFATSTDSDQPTYPSILVTFVAARSKVAGFQLDECDISYNLSRCVFICVVLSFLLPLHGVSGVIGPRGDKHWVFMVGYIKAIYQCKIDVIN